MKMMRSFKIALAFVGLLVGAGFATGQEVIQYFISFGAIGILGAVVSGIIMAVAGAAIIQVGSHFLANDHNMVFRNVAHPVVSKFLDISVTITLFAIGFVMLAGAGSTLEQQFGLPSWIGAAIMTVLVMLAGMLNVDRVSSLISLLTPTIIVAVVVAFVYTMITMSSDIAGLSEIAQQTESPVQPWLLSAVNYNGLALILGVSMCLVIGGNTANPREAGLGGLIGGLLYTVLLVMAAIVMFFNIEAVGSSSVPMLALFESMHPVLAVIMVFIIFAMIFNTAIGMFYALGRRLSAGRQGSYRPIFLVTCLLGYAVSFVGFEALMTYVYPVIGYIGMVMVVVMIVWWLRNRSQVSAETTRRDRLRALVRLRKDPEKAFARGHEKRIRRVQKESAAPGDQLTEAIESEVDDSYLDDDDAAASAPAAPQGTGGSTQA